MRDTQIPGCSGVFTNSADPILPGYWDEYPEKCFEYCPNAVKLGVILGELLAQKLEGAGCKVERRLNMGGTFVCDSAIRSGAIDAYVEYSGTALSAILKNPTADVRAEYAKRALRWSPLLGFNNTFAMIVRKADAERDGLRKISDLGRVGWRKCAPHESADSLQPPDRHGGQQQAEPDESTTSRAKSMRPAPPPFDECSVISHPS